MIEINVHGIPRPGGSKKHVGGHRIIDAGKYTYEWRQYVSAAALPKCVEPLKSCLAIVCYFFVTRPKNHFNAKGELKHSAPKRPGKRPDATKLWRSTEDALTGIAWVDDAQVVDQLVSKQYAAAPGAKIFIEIA